MMARHGQSKQQTSGKSILKQNGKYADVYNIIEYGLIIQLFIKCLN